MTNTRQANTKLIWAIMIGLIATAGLVWILSNQSGSTSIDDEGSALYLASSAPVALDDKQTPSSTQLQMKEAMPDTTHPAGQPLSRAGY